MSESGEVLSNADASYGTDNETIPDTDLPTMEPTKGSEDEKVEKTANEVIREVADNVQSCRVCYDEYHASRNQARVLGCGHSFCTRCVVSCTVPNQNHKDSSGIKCPECRKLCKQAPASLPVNFQLMQILTALSLVKAPLTPEQEKDLPYENFERLGALVPVHELSELSLMEIQEHIRAVFNAFRIVAQRERPTSIGDLTRRSYDAEIIKFSEMEATCHKSIQNMKKIKNGEPIRDLNFPWNPMPDRRALHETDWMREMVVFRPPPNREAPVPPYLLPNPTPPRPTFFATTPPPVPQVPDIDAVLAREQVARAEADPLRNVEVYREAHLRRERGNAQEREAAMRNEQLMRQLIERNENDELPFDRTNPFSFLRHMQEQEQEREMLARMRFNLQDGHQQENIRRAATGLPPVPDHDDVSIDDEEDDNSSIASDDSSYIEEPVQAPPPPPPPMTIGEAITIYRMVEVFAPRYARHGASSFALPNNHSTLNALAADLLPPTSNPTETLSVFQLSAIRRYTGANNIDADRLLKMLRQHSVRYASTLVESPRIVPTRHRRQRPPPADEYNALLSVIRKRAKEALRGNRPPQPADEEESNLTMRLIVNLANSMGVREKLEGVICPHHRAQEEAKEMFVPRTNGSTRQQMLFCTACRCNVPLGSQQVHSQGRKHLAAIANRRTRPQQAQQ